MTNPDYKRSKTMNILRGILVAGSVLLLGGCTAYESFSEVNALNEAQAVGNPFTQQLASEYRDFSNSELKQMFDYPDALHFARKGLAAASGEVVMPEPVTDWNLMPEHVQELGDARARLVAAFDVGAREIDPALSAKAQVKFDCWIEEQEENWQATNILGCKQGFLDAMKELEGKLGNVQPPADVPTPVEPAPVDESVPMAIHDAMYLVFFDWNSSKIGEGGENVLDAVAAEIRKRDGEIVRVNIIGHADTSGAKTYNRKLGLRRANAVKAALVKRGISAEKFMVDTHGEEDLLVKTADNVREPANRRANISFE